MNPPNQNIKADYYHYYRNELEYVQIGMNRFIQKNAEYFLHDEFIKFNKYYALTTFQLRLI